MDGLSRKPCGARNRSPSDRGLITFKECYWMNSADVEELLLLDEAERV